jgi:sulfite reductase (NADPH) hemoprotein beta-component
MSKPTEPVPPRTAADLLRFADLADVDAFIDGLKKYEAGEWTADQFRLYRLNRGTYGQRQADVNMLRIKFPLGAGTAEQLEAVADVAEQYSRGFGHVTTRQAIQLHFMKLGTVPDVQRRLAESGLTTKEACGNTVRNVTGCGMAGCCSGEAFDTTPYGHAVVRAFLRRPENQQLPRKFKIAFSGCGDDCAMGAINDVGAIAQIKDGVRGFKLKVAGGLSTSPDSAKTLYEFLPADRLIGVIEAIIAVFDSHGNRQNKARARLKYVVRKHGFDGFRTLFDKALAEVEAAGRAIQPIDPSPGEVLTRTPSLPITDGGQAAAGPSAAYARFLATNVTAQKQKGFSAVTVRLRRGDITSPQLRGVARIARTFADGQVRLTIDQNLMLRFVSTARLGLVHQELVLLGLGEAEARTIADVTSCPGAESCNLAVTSSRELASALTSKLEAAAADRSGAGVGSNAAVAACQDLTIKISGCPNSCGQHHVANIGFHGGMRRVGGKVVPEYTLHLGGGIDGDGAVFGRTVVKVAARRAPDALLRLLEQYLRERRDGETALAYFRRVDGDAIKAALGDLLKLDEQSTTAEDFLDLGQASEFVVDTKDGECAV